MTSVPKSRVCMECVYKSRRMKLPGHTSVSVQELASMAKSANMVCRQLVLIDIKCCKPNFMGLST